MSFRKDLHMAQGWGQPPGLITLNEARAAERADRTAFVFLDDEEGIRLTYSAGGRSRDAPVLRVRSADLEQHRAVVAAEGEEHRTRVGHGAP
jgi:acyl-CoA synthetase (AMP-forming)/AMP-acid ligase II